MQENGNEPNLLNPKLKPVNKRFIFKDIFPAFVLSLAPFISENLLFIMQENYLSQQRFADLPLHPIVKKALQDKGI